MNRKTWEALGGPAVSPIVPSLLWLAEGKVAELSGTLMGPCLWYIQILDKRPELIRHV